VRVHTARYKGRNHLSTLICEHCNASKVDPTYVYTNFNIDAPHNATAISHEEYLQMASTQSPWTAHLGWRKERVHFDWMHILFVDGVANHLVASLFVVLGAMQFWGPGPIERQLCQATADFRAWIRFHKLGPVSLPKHLLQKSPMPALNSEVKAASTKLMSYWICSVGARAYTFNPTLLMAKNVSMLCYSFAQMLYKSDTGPLILSQAAADEISGYGHAFLITYSYLGYCAGLNGVQCWNIKPKHHYLDESLKFMCSNLENAMKKSSMMEEDFMGKCKRVTKMTHKSAASYRGLQRHLLQVKQRWREMQQP